MCASRPHLAAQLLLFANVVTLRESTLAYDLGERTRRLQIRAMRRRFLHFEEAAAAGDEAALVARLPPHATDLFWCLECGRVANACVDGKTASSLFNESGVSQTMMRTATAKERANIRCAKRSSSTLKTALSDEAPTNERVVEREDLSEGAFWAACAECQRPEVNAMRRNIKPAWTSSRRCEPAATDR